jgi:hypothetical protein
MENAARRGAQLALNAARERFDHGSRSGHGPPPYLTGCAPESIAAKRLPNLAKQ